MMNRYFLGYLGTDSNTPGVLIYASTPGAGMGMSGVATYIEAPRVNSFAVYEDFTSART